MPHNIPNTPSTSHILHSRETYVAHTRKESRGYATHMSQCHNTPHIRSRYERNAVHTSRLRGMLTPT